MKHSISISLVLTLFISVVACKKGDTGPAGTDGNANVTQYNFGTQNLFSSVYATLLVNTTADTMNRSQWFVYLYYQPIDRWYLVPGHGFAASTQYRVSLQHTGGKVNIFIDKVGPGENYAQARVVRIYANNMLQGGRTSGRTNNGLPDIDFSDYETVRQYYHLPE